MTTGQQLRDKGVADVLAADQAAHRRYAELAFELVEEFIAEGRTFCADDIRAAMPEHIKAHHPNVFGGIFSSLAAKGRIEWAGDYRSTRTARRKGRASYWKGVTE